MGLNLFEGSSSSSEDEDASNIKINEEFACRFEHNKRREDLQRFEELKKQGVIEDTSTSSTSSESDDDLIESDRNELKFYNALVKVKKQDPILNEKDTKLFDSDNEIDSEETRGKGGEVGDKKKNKQKPVYLKDVMAKQLIEEGPEFEEKRAEFPLKSYNDEQEEIRQAFLREAEDVFEDDEGEFLVEKKRNEEDGVAGDGDDGEIQKRLDEYFGEDSNLSENEMFLKSFFKNKMWVDKEKEKKPLDEEIGFSEDEDELEKQDKYESEYNFRYEEGAGDRVLGHSRFIEGSVRKTTNARKEQRKSKAERMKKAEFERQEELKHLKNVKRKEILEKLEKIREVAGIAEDGACTFDGDDLEEEFDPEEYDRMMKKAFNEEYYDAEDVDSGFGSDDEGDLEKPDFDKEDELLGLPKGWDVLESGGGFREARKKVLKNDEGEDAELSDGLDREEEMGGGMDQEEVGEGGKRKRKRKMSFKEKVALDKELDEYYKLDYEDTIGDLKTRFKYTSVHPNKYGLSTAEILMTDEKELNQYVSLKKLAPFREAEWKVSKQKRYQQKLKKKLLLEGLKSEDVKIGKKRKSKHHGQAASLVSGSTENRQTQLEESNGEAGPTSRKSRRKHRQAEFKLSKSRLMAYGKIPSNSKRQKNK